MEPPLENGWFEQEEVARSESGSSVGEETEVLLYSLVHHKPTAEDDLDRVPNPSLAEESPSFGVSKRTKAARWDGVQGIVAGSENVSSTEQLVVTSSSDLDARPAERDALEGTFESRVAPDFIRVGEEVPDRPQKVSKSKRYFADGSQTQEGTFESRVAPDFIKLGEDEPDGLRKISKHKRYFAEGNQTVDVSSESREAPFFIRSGEEESSRLHNTSRNKRHFAREKEVRPWYVNSDDRTPWKQNLATSVSERRQRTPLNDSLPSLEPNASERTPRNRSQVSTEGNQSASPKNDSSDIINAEIQRPKPNLRAVLEALAGYPSPMSLENKKKKKRKQKKKKKNRELSSSGISNNREELSVLDERSDNTDLSKYNVAMSTPKSKDDASCNVIELLSDSDAESRNSDDSIVVVEKPPKTPPPVIDLDESSDESENHARPSTSSNTPSTQSVSTSSRAVDVQSRTSDALIVNCSPSGQQVNLASSNANSSIIILSDTEEAGSRKRKRSKSGTNGRKRRRTGNGATPLWSDCESWTPDMARFYNQSWGERDLDEVRRNMPGDPRHWKILPVDRFGPMKRSGPLARVRCRNCNQHGHLVNNCPDPTRKIVCYMCGEEGHKEPRCPNKICLKCGKPSMAFLSGCMMCQAPGSPPFLCTMCGRMGHYVNQCPGAWRRLHMVTSPADEASHLLPPTVYKLPHELSCSMCGKKGHDALNCNRNSSGRLYFVPGSSPDPKQPPRFGRAPGNANGNQPPPPRAKGKKRRREKNLETKGNPQKKRPRQGRRNERPRFRESYINFLKIP